MEVYSKNQHLNPLSVEIKLFHVCVSLISDFCIGNELNYCKLLSSKLASLFGGSSEKNEGENESLRYTAPKEPKKKKPGKTYATLQKTKNGVFIQIMHLFHCLLNGNKHKHL